MKLVLGGLPKLPQALYLSNRLKPNNKPSIDIHLRHIHMLFQALYYDNLITASDIQYFEKIIPDTLHEMFFREREDGEVDRILLTELEAFVDKHAELIMHLRGYFKPYDQSVNGNNDNIILPIIPGLANTSLLQCLVYRRKNYIIDLRDNGVNLNFLKSIIGALDGEVYIVSNTIILNPYEIIVGNVDINVLKNLSHEPYNYLNKVIRLGVDAKGNYMGIYKVKGNAPELINSCKTYNAEYVSEEPVDALKPGFKVKNDYSNDIENLLFDIWSNGAYTEPNLLNALMDIFKKSKNNDFISRTALYLMLRYGLLTYSTTPTGRLYTVSLKGMRILLEREERRRKGGEEDGAEGTDEPR